MNPHSTVLLDETLNQGFRLPITLMLCWPDFRSEFTHSPFTVHSHPTRIMHVVFKIKKFYTVLDKNIVNLETQNEI